jgi:glycosyltransferase involved in cell wall biosynthesis
MRVVIATDTWEPSINGVVRSLRMTAEHLEKKGHEVIVLHPGLGKAIPFPWYPDVDLTWYMSKRLIAETIKPPCAVHIASEGPLGLKIANYCYKRDIPYTTSYHTNFPEYFWEHAYIPSWLTYWYMRRFHGKSKRVLTRTQSTLQKLEQKGFKAPMVVWPGGVDTTMFHPRYKGFVKPIALYVGRISYEKGIEDFLKTDGNYDKWVVGDGPYLHYFKEKYPDAYYFGFLRGEALASAYAHADVFVFPSKTDTFGLVMVEALASGVPVAAYPVEGPKDIIQNGMGIGHLSENLQEAIDVSLATRCSESCVLWSRKFDWANCTDIFYNNLVIYESDHSRNS